MENQHEDDITKENERHKKKSQLEDNHNPMEEDRFSKLPLDVTIDILSRLPLKTLSNCQWVSKTWYNSTLHPRLAEIHFSKYKHTLPCAVFHSRYQGTHLINPGCLHARPTTVTGYKLDLKQLRKTFTISNGWNCFEVVGTVNGMVCFSPERCDYEPAPFYICNPITRDFVLLPRSPKVDVEHLGSGFGFDELNNEYKVVRMLHDSSEVEIYTLGSGMWRQIEMAGVPCVADMRTQYNVFVNGCLHWTVCIKDGSKRYETILSFNVAAEEFGLIEMPPLSNTRETILRWLDLIVLGDCLCVVDGGFMNSKDIWVMKTYGVGSSWVKQYVIECDDLFCGWHGFHEALDLNNNVLLLLNKEGGLSYYDCQKKTSKQILVRNIKGKQVDLQKDYPIYFTASLFSPSAIEGEKTRNWH